MLGHRLSEKNKLWGEEKRRRKLLHTNTPNKGIDRRPKKRRGTEEESLGLNILMRAFVGKDKFVGNWEENLYTFISIFETMNTMCEVDDDEKLKWVPLMLADDALKFF